MNATAPAAVSAGKTEIYAALLAPGFLELLAARLGQTGVHGLSAFAAQGTGLLTLADRVLAATPAATLEMVIEAIVADRVAVSAKNSRKVRRGKAGERADARVLATLATARDEEVRALSTDADLAR